MIQTDSDTEMQAGSAGPCRPEPAGRAGRLLCLAAGLLIAAYPTLVWAVDHGGSSTYNVLVLSGIICFCVQRRRLLGSEERWLGLALVAYPAIATLSWLANGMDAVTERQLDRYLLILGGVPVMYLMAWLRPRPAFLWWGGTIGATLLGVYALYMTRVGQVAGLREALMLHSQVNYINFGQISLINSCIAAVSVPYFLRWKRWAFVLPMGGVLLGLTAMGLSLTRGAWIALPALVLLLMAAGRREIIRHRLAASVVMVLLLAGAAGMYHNDNVRERITLAVDEVAAYGRDDRGSTPIGARLEMYRLSWRIFLEHPFLGVGKGGYQQRLSKLVQEGEMHPYVGRHGFPHSEFASQLAYHGLAGLSGVTLLLVIPGALFARRLRSSSGQRRMTSLAGLLFLVAYFHFMFTDSVFEQRTTIIYYTLLVPMLLSLTVRGCGDETRSGKLHESS